MHSSIPRLLLPALLWTVSSCLELEEEIRVHADGSIDVRIVVEGDASDVADGYPIPLDGPWQAADEPTRRWLESIGADTGGADVRRRVAEGVWGDERARLEVRAHFASCADVPALHAPPAEPYRSAFLGRTSSLTIERKGARTITTFERVYVGRTHPGWDHFASLEGELPAGALDDFAALTDDEIVSIARAYARAFERYAQELARHALGAEYTVGAAELSLEHHRRILRGVRREVDRLGSEVRLREVLVWMRAAERDGAQEGEAHPLPRYAADWREALRGSLNEGLARADLPVRTVNGILERLESDLTAMQHTGDLEDEQFHVRIHMPGTIVDGNFDELAGGHASWSFSGEDLKRRDQVLRIVSVTE